MKPSLRKFILTLHITLSVGWLGAVIGYLALAIIGLTSHDAQRVQSAYQAMEVIGWFVIVPCSLTTLFVGLVASLGTPWGLFRYWWVVVKFLLTTGATIVLLQHMPAVIRMADIARETTLSTTDFRELRTQLVVHASGGLLVLLTATVLSVFKPWGMTPYGRRKVSIAASSSRSESTAKVFLRPSARTPRWVYVVSIHVIGLILVGLAVHLTGGDMLNH